MTSAPIIVVFALVFTLFVRVGYFQFKVIWLLRRQSGSKFALFLDAEQNQRLSNALSEFINGGLERDLRRKWLQSWLWAFGGFFALAVTIVLMADG